MAADSDSDEAPPVVGVASPVLSRVMFLFQPPPGLDSTEMRRRAGIALVASVALMAFVYWVTPRLMAMHGGISKGAFGIFLIFYGLSFLLVPACLYRLIYGVPDPHDGNGIVRGMVAVVLFFVTAFASCILYGQLT